MSAPWYDDASLAARARREPWLGLAGRSLASRLAPVVSRRALGFGFEVHADDEALAAVVDRLYGDFDPPGTPGGAATLSVVHDRRGGPERFRVYADGGPVARCRTPDLALSYLMWLVNRGVITHSRDRLLFHAAAASQEDSGVLLPASMESGKTTLVAGLVASGLSYLSDEVGALDLQSGELVAYPKPLTVDPGSFRVLGALPARVPGALRPWYGRQWQVPHAALRPGPPARRCRVRHVVFPRYAAGAVTELAPLRRTEALALLVENSFNFADRPGEHLEAMAEMLRGATCHRLVSGDLEEACRGVLALMGAEPLEGAVAALRDDRPAPDGSAADALGGAA
ncbi:MAG: hypothetical protein ACRDYD_01300 [Acidimicrobiales bacterium]